MKFQILNNNVQINKKSNILTILYYIFLLKNNNLIFYTILYKYLSSKSDTMFKNYL